MSKLILYGDKLSPPVCSVLLTAAELGVELEFKLVDLFKLEHLSPEFQKINPTHSVPVLEDDGRYICDSHAIITYLVSKYGKDDSLYPKDLYKRAVVDQRLHFDSGVLYIRARNMSFRIYIEEKPVLPEEGIQAIYEGFDFLEKFLENGPYVTGDTLTVADFSCICSVTCCGLYAPVSAERYPRITAWVKRISELPYYESASGANNERYIQFLKDMLAQKNVTL